MSDSSFQKFPPKRKRSTIISEEEWQELVNFFKKKGLVDTITKKRTNQI
ncbi:hypothetical protein J2Z62_000737 [Mycoplasmoides fastidiosum]|uniref:Uncharacterized protein n=1 Tax=Mycoplasmoides fastidiosum TaxID=92758 RepID=A0ABU0M015_9BACT|nr:hypothetical protein [Mycoplasmoides fastidiosum]